MVANSSEYITLADLYLAYKKAKVEAFRENTYVDAIGFSCYENNLDKNLIQLHSILSDPGNSWARNLSIVGGHTYIPKSLNRDMWNSKDDLFYRAIDPLEDWNKQFESSGCKRAEASFRLIITPTIDFQIISALWIIKVGHLYEACIDTNVSYANRLRRSNSKSSFYPYKKEINKNSGDLFHPYFSAYRSWRDKGLNAMRSALNNKKSILAVTMDIRQFYHQVSPVFLLRPLFLRKLGLSLTDHQTEFTQCLLNAIDTWYKNTPDCKDRPDGALPVGLSASKIISNVLLCEFDSEMKERICPLYYGRYVDDIFLVLEKSDKINSGNNLLHWLSKTLGHHVKYGKKHKNGPYLQAKYSYASDCSLIFPADKQKIFELSPPHGLDLVSQISEQIRAQSSEYKLLSELPSSNIDMASRALLASPDATLQADALRKADAISVKRLGFSLLLSDVENYERDLKPNDWFKVRHEFYELVNRYLLTPAGIFQFTRYLYRVFSLSIACRDFDFAESFLKKFEKVLSILEHTTSAGSINKEHFQCCKSYFFNSYIQAAIQGSTVRQFKFPKEFTNIIKRLSSSGTIQSIKANKQGLTAISKQILLSDFGRRPYKDYWYYEQTEDFSKEPVPQNTSVRKHLRISSIRLFRKVAELNVPYWKALAFPTRPLTLSEIGLIAPRILEDEDALKRSILGLRGAQVASDMSFGMKIEDDLCATMMKNRYIQAPSSCISSTKRVALTNIETTTEQWELAAKGNPDRSLDRYKKIIRIVNQILCDEQRVDYIVFPECSIPRRWAISIALKLARNGISFLAGLEYYKSKNVDELRNDCLVCLSTNWPGYDTGIIYLQPKLQPSHEERAQLKKLKSKSLYVPKHSTLPIYIHSGFHFGALICSDLTDISNRHYFQGHVDAMFVLEWNQDINTFGFLVESAAHDIHTYIIQVNNRKYGDSRIRAPYREEYKRDSVRIKGGVSDYYVIGEIDHSALRNSQSLQNQKNNEIKPVPIGFKLSSLRK